MRYRIPGRASAGGISSRQSTAKAAVEKAREMMKEGLRRVRITDTFTGHAYTSDEFPLLLASTCDA
jgi:hypothetical protein